MSPVVAGMTALFLFPVFIEAKARRPAPGQATEVYSLSEGKPVPIAARKAKLPLIVYGEGAGASATYVPSGYMGDAGSLKMKSVDFSAPLSSTKTGSGCLRFEALPRGREGWSGIYWQTPANNWGKIKGAGYDLTAAKKLTFWARGEKGGERVTEVKFGGLIGPYPDTDGGSLGPLQLSKEWTKYTFDLTEKDLRHIIGGFAVSVRRSDNPRGAVFYIDEIVYEGEMTTDTVPPASLSAEPVNVPVVVDTAPSPAPAKLTKPVKIIVPFQNAKSAFSLRGREGMDEIAAVAINAPDAKLIVEGHTDSTGPRHVNKKLSFERARAVADYLVSKGVPRGQITMEGLGDEKPIREGSNATAQGRMENRRVEITLVPK